MTKDKTTSAIAPSVTEPSGPAGVAAGSGGDDIATLLRAISDDIRDDRLAADRDDPDDDEEYGDEEEEEPRRAIPYGKIAAALIAAAGIGFAVVMLDSLRDPPGPVGSEAETAAVDAAPAAPPSLLQRVPAPAPAPATITEPVAPPPSPSAADGTAPQPLIARAPLPSAAPEPASEPARAAAPAPESTVVEPDEEAAGQDDAADLPDPDAEPMPPAAPLPGGPAAAAQPPAAPPAAAPAPATAARGPTRPPAGAPAGRYTVQVGTFRDAANATALVRRLTERGYRAYAMGWTDPEGRSWTAVRVGGYEGRGEATRVAGELQGVLGLTPIVVGTR
ncbi:SPOR domain-containing protein [Azospirillum halopraeferens]|uniref:SPOR domain-containing protein n=1 Tax=Azospirillum halopraeferens TaxID=34010 RepID=UPI00040F350D|nr:SPOR domain-containing protein [Azospirillum halopraeferens]